MGVPRTLGAVTVVPGKPVPAVLAAAGYSGVVLSIATVSIATGGLATIVLSTASEAGSTFPTNGFNGPNGYPTHNATTGALNDFQGKWPAANGQQITMWGFTGTATSMNGKTVSVVNNNPSANSGAGSFSFYFGTTFLAATSETGLVAPSPIHVLATVLGSDLHTPVRQPWLLGQRFHRGLVARARDLVKEITVGAFKLAEVCGFLKACAVFPLHHERINLDQGAGNVPEPRDALHQVVKHDRDSPLLME
jgi:hypothetical protein